MPDGLSVIRRIAAGAPDPSPEAQILRQSLAALDALPARTPDADVLARVAARAAEASTLDELAAIRGAMGLGPVQGTPEGAILAQSVAALDTLPTYPPAPEAVASVSAQAEAATFAAVRAIEAGPIPATPEGELLRQSVAALSTLPRYAPSDDALTAVLARAEAASVAPVLAAYDEDVDVVSSEVALLAQSRAALDTLPRYAPSGEAVAAVLAAAAVNAPPSPPLVSPVPAASPAAPRRRAADRGAVASSRTGVWAGFATLAVAIIAAVVFLQPPAELAPVSADIVEEAPVSPSAREVAVAAEPESEFEAAGGAPPVVAAPEQQIRPRRAPSGPSAEGFVPVVERREVTAPAPAAADRVALADDEGKGATTDWDAGDDLRLLSLRLRQLREQNEGIGWDTPSVSFGASGPQAEGTTPGIRSVREGPPAGAIRMRSLPTDSTQRR